jgi:hypothetical protein
LKARKKKMEEALSEALSSFDFDELVASLADAIAATSTPKPLVEFSLHALMAELFKRTKTLPKAEVSRTFFRAVSIGLLRGNIRKDQLERTCDAGKAIIKRVAAILGIEIRDKGQRKLVLTNKTVTFSRMIAIFPHWASQLMVSKESLFVNRFASFNDANRFPAQTHKLPIAMLHSGFAGLIPRESDDMEFIDLICMCHSAFMAEFSLLITPQEQRSFHALYENQKRYTEAARGSGFNSDENRIVYLLRFGLLSSDSLDKMLKVAARVSTLSARQEEASVTRDSFTIVEDRVKIVNDDAKWDELLKKAKRIVDASSSMRSQVAAVDSLDGV